MKSKTVVESIDWFGREEPDRVAYQSDDARYTFGELKKKSDALANYLVKNVVGNDPIVYLEI